MTDTLGGALKRARVTCALPLREVERRVGVKSGHLSQIETGKIAQPEPAILWDLAVLYELDFGRLLHLAGYAGGAETSRRRRQRITVALRALGDLSPGEQEDALEYMAELRRRRDGT